MAVTHQFPVSVGQFGHAATREAQSVTGSANIPINVNESKRDLGFPQVSRVPPRVHSCFIVAASPSAPFGRSTAELRPKMPSDWGW